MNGRCSNNNIGNNKDNNNKWNTNIATTTTKIRNNDPELLSEVS